MQSPTQGSAAHTSTEVTQPNRNPQPTDFAPSRRVRFAPMSPFRRQRALIKGAAAPALGWRPVA